jgi:hypothetical protein
LEPSLVDQRFWLIDLDHVVEQGELMCSAAWLTCSASLLLATPIADAPVSKAAAVRPTIEWVAFIIVSFSSVERRDFCVATGPLQLSENLVARPARGGGLVGNEPGRVGADITDAPEVARETCRVDHLGRLGDLERMLELMGDGADFSIRMTNTPGVYQNPEVRVAAVPTHRVEEAARHCGIRARASIHEDQPVASFQAVEQGRERRRTRGALPEQT